MTRPTSSAPSQRMLRVGEQVRAAITQVLQRGEVRDDVIEALNRHAKFIRGRLGPQLRQMKYMPEVRFRDDTSFDNYKKIDELLKSPEVQRDLGAKASDDEQE